MALVLLKESTTREDQDALSASMNAMGVKMTWNGESSNMEEAVRS
jgi:hypothetical protein